MPPNLRGAWPPAILFGVIAVVLLVLVSMGWNLGPNAQDVLSLRIAAYLACLSPVVLRPWVS
jgi:hypothetical protein